MSTPDGSDNSTTATNTTTAAEPRLSRVVVPTATALALTAPGQTPAVSVFVDPIIESLGLSRTVVSTAYMAGSISGALVMPLLGRVIDRFGPRTIMAAIGACFGIILLAASTVSGIIGLTAAFIGIRVGGQGALNLVATTTVAVYVHRRRGFAMGLTSAIGTAGISLVPVLLERLVSQLGWREVWALEGTVVLALVVPAALLVLPRDPPRPEGHRGESASGGGTGRRNGPAVDWTLSEAMRTGMFWVVASGVGVCSLVATALTFHQVSLLGERGLSAAQAAAVFIPQTLAGLAASFLLGWLADHVADRVLIVATMTVLAVATLGAGWVHPGWTAFAYGLALGVCTNGIRTLEAVAFPRCFGLRHIGSIRGVVHSVTVGASAFGPPLLAIGRSMTVSYRPVLLMLCLLPVAVVVAAVLTRDPPPAPPNRPPTERDEEQPAAGPAEDRSD
ncbi:Cyanate permease [Actinopolyspora alba]|uniref:Cyanate permease n=1 Tax=Actinopolyspora alba TaxID=673379 RepID=A0A1I1VVF6_9ACTN|nr:MFS transporter [Actinopolyspora alba]SFD85043.1 Cyanate permease [Actinopolyspora alba]